MHIAESWSWELNMTALVASPRVEYWNLVNFTSAVPAHTSLLPDASSQTSAVGALDHWLRHVVVVGTPASLQSRLLQESGRLWREPSRHSLET